MDNKPKALDKLGEKSIQTLYGFKVSYLTNAQHKEYVFTQKDRAKIRGYLLALEETETITHKVIQEG